MNGLTTSAEETSFVYQPGRHVSQLDGLRGLAILLVTVYRFGKDVPTDTSAGWLMANGLRAGQYGVELFFVLSGFLITGILLDSRGAPRQLRNFFVRRSLRILPLYMASLAVMSMAIGWLSQTNYAGALVDSFRAAYDQQIYLWYYLTNVRMSMVGSWCFGPLDHFWSLAVEEHFYFLWPLVVIFCLPRHVLRIALGGAVLAMLGRTLWLAGGGQPTVAEVFTLMRCDGLLLGCAIAVMVRQPLGLERYHRWAVGCCAACLLAGFVLAFSQRRVLMAGSICWTLGWSALLIWLVSSRSSSPLAWLLDRRWLRGLGKLSYGMYVFQSPLIPVVAWLGTLSGYRIDGAQGLLGALVYIAGMFALTTGLALCSWHLFEKHWLHLKEIFPQTAVLAQPNSMDSAGGVPPGQMPTSWATSSLANIVTLGVLSSGKAPSRG